jgi:MSHA biogenesis protein MshM
VWQSYWKLSGDPFLGHSRCFVPSTTHEEAVARLVSTIESGQRLAVVRAGAGLGKSAVIAEALARTRNPARRFSRVVCPIDALALYAGLAEGLGRRLPRGFGKPSAWAALVEAVRLCHWQKLQPVLIVDGLEHSEDGPSRSDLERLVHLSPNASGRLTVVAAIRETEESPGLAFGPDWQLAIRLLCLTRTETALYVRLKLASAGRSDEAFTPRALNRMYSISTGEPRGIDRLASLGLMAGAYRRLEVVTPDVIDGVAAECLGNRLVGTLGIIGEAGWPGPAGFC